MSHALEDLNLDVWAPLFGEDDGTMNESRMETKGTSIQIEG